MSYEFYKFIHLIGLLFLFSGLVTILILAFTNQLATSRARSLGFATHGLGLLLMLLGGFGMAARLELMRNLPGWLYGKIVIWLLLAISISWLRRQGRLLIPNLLALLLFGATAAYLAIYKPF